MSASRPVSYARHPRYRWRWPSVVLTCLSLASSYYVYDMPAALNRPLRQQLDMSHHEWQYWLAGAYAAYALPNVIMPFCAPQLMSKLGPRCLFVLLATIALVGQWCFVLSLVPMTTNMTTTQHSLPLFLGGRFLLGLGVESLGVAQSSLTCQWFASSRRLGMALSLNVIMARMGAIINDVTSPLLWYQWENPSHHWMKQLLHWLSMHGIPEYTLNGVIIAQSSGYYHRDIGGLLVERRSTRNPEISLVVTAEESQPTHPNGGRQSSVDEQPLLLNHRRSTIYGTTEWNRSGSSLNIPPTSNLSQPVLHPHIPFSSVRRQVSARDIQSIRHSYFRTDRLRRTSGIYRRHSRPPITNGRTRQRSSVDSVWVPPITGHGSSTPPTPYSPNIDEIPRQHAHSDTDHERLTTSADAIIPYSVLGTIENHSRDLSLATINTTLSASVTTFSYTWSFSLLCFSMICAIIPLVNVASDYLLTRWTTNPIHAGLLMALPDLISTLLVPLGAEKCYYRSRQHPILLWVGVVMILSHWYLGVGNPQQWQGIGVIVALVALGLCYGAFSVIFWSALPQVLPNANHHPLAYARMTGLLIYPYRLFMAISLMATITAALLYYTNILSNSDIDRDAHQYNDVYDSCSEYGDDCYNDYWSEEFSDAWESPDEDGEEDDNSNVDDADVTIHQIHEAIGAMNIGERDKNAHRINDHMYVHPLPSVESTLRNHLSSSPAYQSRNEPRPRYETA
ncbi:hypothetical protein BDF22DRAFT_740928 [Syncephalis plumigaleata]|nr:hypothetical protein BDF22DRAFT_740928 [Syncephalis plumigaleata]